MDLDARVLVVGQCGWVGSAVARRLWAAGFNDVRLIEPRELDLTRQGAVEAFFLKERPQYVFLVGARGAAEGDGGRLGDPLRESLAVQANVIHAAWRAAVQKFCFIVSSGMYPAQPLPPMRGGALLTTALEPDHEGPAIAQLAGLRLCQVYRRQYRFDAISLVPAELYGPGDRLVGDKPFLPALIRRMHRASRVRAPEVVLDAVPPREFLQVDDLADAALFAMCRYSDDIPMNVGAEAIGIYDLGEMVAGAVGYGGRIAVQGVLSAPPGSSADVLQLSALGWTPCMPLRLGVAQTCAWFLARTEEVPA
ncbi:NAD-dependent epimerase/dehydratase family protein [Frateuria hangzhouensis]|uniref:NAD-dependent epimerase/dehydratase family protein n=1 Tax=Frateuria hangzhouensis TaxID=2995589 RepID=UPI0022609F29|nr:NAD-dependent epimerase/dehydratase family protein [Frateuria sp. STR12]MCX7515320.1 NAD-dependent epimerase/dehydratase family protein [Frateuria sp. STR12]